MYENLATRLAGMVSGALIACGIALFMYGPSELGSGVEGLPRAVPMAVGEPQPILIAELVPPMQVTADEFECLTKNIFHEAGVEGWEGKIGVGQVTLNRMSSKRWNNTICKVVYERKQFSWTNDAKLRLQKPKGPLWEASRKAARDIVAGVRLPELKTALFYHTDYIEAPVWASPKFLLAQVGQHLYYDNDLKK